MKDIIDEIDSRIKSPFFGYFVFSFVAINWAELFYLMLDSGTVDGRIEYFRNGTDFYSLIIYPFLVAATYSIAYPWLQYFFMWSSGKPNDLKNNLQAGSEHTLLVEKQKLETKRNELLKSAEAELIERAKRDAELSEIEDKDIRESLQAEIEQLRKERDAHRSSTNNPEQKDKLDISQEQIDILVLITQNGGSMIEGNVIDKSPHDRVKTEYYLEDLQSKEFVTKKYNQVGGYYDINLATISKKLMVDLGVV